MQDSPKSVLKGKGHFFFQQKVVVILTFVTIYLTWNPKPYLRIESFFRAHMEYKRTDGGLKIP